MSKNKTPSGLPPDPKLNRILASLPAGDYERLLTDLELVEMPLGWTMSESGDHVNYLHFPTSGIVSLIYSLEDGSSSETALVGNEGLVGISIFMGGESMPTSTEVQSAGQAYRLSRKVMKREFSRRPTATHGIVVHSGDDCPDIANGRMQPASFAGSKDVPVVADDPGSFRQQ